MCKCFYIKVLFYYVLRNKYERLPRSTRQKWNMTSWMYFTCWLITTWRYKYDSDVKSLTSSNQNTCASSNMQIKHVFLLGAKSRLEAHLHKTRFCLFLSVATNESADSTKPAKYNMFLFSLKMNGFVIVVRDISLSMFNVIMYKQFY